MSILNKKILGIIAITVNLIVSLVELLILFKAIPFDIIMGGMMETYEQAPVVATSSIVIQGLISVCIAVASDIIQSHKLKKFSNIVLVIFTVYFSINIILNLLGKTWFEKVVASLMCLINIVCFIGILKANKKEK